jgi:hypothetical protein
MSVIGVSEAALRCFQHSQGMADIGDITEDVQAAGERAVRLVKGFPADQELITMLRSFVIFIHFLSPGLSWSAVFAVVVPVLADFAGDPAVGFDLGQCAGPHGAVSFLDLAALIAAESNRPVVAVPLETHCPIS